MYGKSQAQLRDALDAAHNALLQELHGNVNKYRWPNVTSPKALADAWYQAAQLFLTDYPQGLREGRYIMAKPPQFDFADGEFDLALCSHFLFHKYFHEESQQFLIDVILALARIASEVRIFPATRCQGSHFETDWAGYASFTST